MWERENEIWKSLKRKVTWARRGIFVCECVSEWESCCTRWWYCEQAVLRRDVNEPVRSHTNSALILLVGKIFCVKGEMANCRNMTLNCNSSNCSSRLQSSNKKTDGGQADDTTNLQRIIKKNKWKAVIFSKMTTIICTKRQRAWHFKRG